jgi:hypothetical protein
MAFLFGPARSNWNSQYEVCGLSELEMKRKPKPERSNLLLIVMVLAAALLLLARMAVFVAGRPHHKF